MFLVVPNNLADRNTQYMDARYPSASLSLLAGIPLKFKENI